MYDILHHLETPISSEVETEDTGYVINSFKCSGMQNVL